MLPRERRLHADRDWDALFQHGFGVSGTLFSFRLRRTPGVRRLGVSVGKKVGGAVTRNLVKRRLRALAAAHWDRLPEADIAVLARPACAAATFAALEAAFLDAAERALKRAPAGERT